MNENKENLTGEARDKYIDLETKKMFLDILNSEEDAKFKQFLTELAMKISKETTKKLTKNERIRLVIEAEFAKTALKLVETLRQEFKKYDIDEEVFKAEMILELRSLEQKNKVKQ